MNLSINLSWWQQLIALFTMDAAWNAFLAMMKSEKRAIKALKWLDRKTKGKKINGPTMATACMLYGLISVYGFFGAARFIFKLRRQVTTQNRRAHGKRT